MSANVSNLLYLVAGVLFIMALRGLSHPTTSRQGNLYGMIGMGIAIATTLTADVNRDGAAVMARHEIRAELRAISAKVEGSRSQVMMGRSMACW